jgi:hypothetical protein
VLVRAPSSTASPAAPSIWPSGAGRPRVSDPGRGCARRSASSRSRPSTRRRPATSPRRTRGGPGARRSRSSARSWTATRSDPSSASGCATPELIRGLRCARTATSMATRSRSSRLGTETLAFKREVRKLKELGLTESLETGYRLSPRRGLRDGTLSAGTHVRPSGRQPLPGAVRTGTAGMRTARRTRAAAHRRRAAARGWGPRSSS